MVISKTLQQGQLNLSNEKVQKVGQQYIQETATAHTQYQKHIRTVIISRNQVKCLFQRILDPLDTNKSSEPPKHSHSIQIPSLHRPGGILIDNYNVNHKHISENYEEKVGNLQRLLHRNLPLNFPHKTNNFRLN